MKRRKFIQSASLGAASLANLGFNDFKNIPPHAKGAIYMGGFRAPAKKTLRAAFIGLGYRGNDHLRNFASLEGTEVVGLCDLYEDLVNEKLATLNEIKPNLGMQEVKTYWGDEELWRTMLDEVQPDLCLLYTSPSPRDLSTSRMPSSA